MATNSPIEWTEATWNPVAGCTVLSPGCTNCYAMRLAGAACRRSAPEEPSRAGRGTSCLTRNGASTL
ncbi:DUF5131 family protein [Reyranella sp.]|uniref:DUF5131 family protein n=1 Tax=Reyranella sp. TaxID=1929291 RepID=UPI003D1308AF